MRRLLVIFAALFAVSGSAFAQTADWGLNKTCQSVLAAGEGHPQFRLIVGEWNGARTHSVQLQLADAAVAGPARIEVHRASFDLEGTASGNQLNINVGDNWIALLDALVLGETLSITSAANTYTIPLAGSANAIKALRRCTR